MGASGHRLAGRTGEGHAAAAQQRHRLASGRPGLCGSNFMGFRHAFSLGRVTEHSSGPTPSRKHPSGVLPLQPLGCGPSPPPRPCALSRRSPSSNRQWFWGRGGLIEDIAHPLSVAGHGALPWCRDPVRWGHLGYLRQCHQNTGHPRPAHLDPASSGNCNSDPARHCAVGTVQVWRTQVRLLRGADGSPAACRLQLLQCPTFSKQCRTIRNSSKV